jgi:hypothetical protein
MRMLALIGNPLIDPPAAPFKLLCYLVRLMTGSKHLNGQTTPLRLWLSGLTCL